MSFENKMYQSDKGCDKQYGMGDHPDKKFAGGLSLYYFQEMGRKTAADYLLETDKPVLIMQGGKDFQVLPEEDFEGFKEILKDKENVSYKLYEDLNHVFVKGLYNDITKASKEYKQMSQSVYDAQSDAIITAAKKVFFQCYLLEKL